MKARLVLTGLVLFLVVVYLLRNALTPFAVAFALAYFLNPTVGGLERVLSRSFRRYPRLSARVDARAVALFILVVVVLLVVAAVLLVVVPKVYQQVADTAVKLPDYAATLRQRIEPLYNRLNLQYPSQMEQARLRLQEALRTTGPSLLSPVSQALAGAFSSLLAFVLALLNVVIVPVFAVYLLYDMERIQLGLRELVPHRYRPYVYSRMADVGRLLAAFVRGQLTVCLILGTFYAVALTVCGVPMGVLVGMAIGFFNLVPFMSIVLGLPLALLLSWLDDRSLPALLAVAGCFAFANLVDVNFVTPRVVGKTLGLHALIIILAVFIGAKVFGFVGMLLAVPTTAALSVFWSDIRAAYLESPFFGASAPPPPPVA